MKFLVDAEKFLIKKNLFRKISLIIILVVSITIIIQLYLIGGLSRKAIFLQESQNALNILSTLKNFVTSKYEEIEDYKYRSLEAHKQHLIDITAIAMGNLDYYYTLWQQGKLSEAKAKEYAINSTRNMIYGTNDYIFITNYDCKVIAHLNKDILGQDFSEVKDVHGNLVVAPLVDMATSEKGKGFHRYYWKRFENSEPIEKLSYVENFSGWKWTVGTGVYIDDIDIGVSEKKEKMLWEIKEYFKHMKLGETGYSYIFNESGEILVHPKSTLEGGKFNEIINPGKGTLLQEDLLNMAQKPWGQNYLTYYWDKPEDPENYKYKKICYITKIEPLNWYIGSTIYEDDLHSLGNKIAIRTFTIGILMMALIILLLDFIMKNHIFDPLASILMVVNKVTKDNYNEKIPITNDDEIGRLAKSFNEMIDKLHVKERVNKKYALRLEEMNRDLEEKVLDRTQELAQKNEILTAHQIQLQKAYDDLKQLDILKSDFLSSVSHELRTPLTSILGFAKITQKIYQKLIKKLNPHITDEKSQKYIPRIENNLNIITNEGERLTRLINEVLDIAKIESGKMEWHDHSINFNAVITEAISIANGFFLEKTNIQFMTDIDNNLGNVNVDKDRIIQVINNLISNAIKFTPSGNITFKAFRSNTYIQIEVWDTGIGIGAEEQESIFEKFKQIGDTLTNKPKGTGLGLPICKEIINHYKGKIWVESGLDKGSKFKFIIPIENTGEQK